MRRHKHNDGEASFGTDSFLDVVSNMVAILIILVMVVGVRAKDAAPPSLPPQPPEEPEDVQAAHRRARGLTEEAMRQASQVDQLLALRQVRTHERDQLATLAAAARREIEAQRQTLDEQSQRTLGLRRTLGLAQQEATGLERRLAHARLATENTIEIKSYATPLSRTVDGDEVHFQLKGGRLVYIPFQDLIEAVRDVWQQQLWKLKTQPSVTDTLGPIDGFRVRYTVVRAEVPLEAQLAGAQAGRVYQVDQWELIPIAGEMGETVEQALGERSQFRATLAEHNPRRTTVTLWVYPDSFGDYRQVKEVLRAQNFPIAGRPMTEHQLIGASPRGSKSAAQ